VSLSDRDTARAFAELHAGELLALARLTVRRGAARGDDGVPPAVWRLYARIALWIPPAPAPRPRPIVG
jgi:hypothetical protein